MITRSVELEHSVGRPIACLFSGELGSNSRDILPPTFLKGIIFQIFFEELST